MTAYSRTTCPKDGSPLTELGGFLICSAHNHAFRPDEQVRHGLVPDALQRAGIDRVAAEMKAQKCPTEHEEQCSLIAWAEAQKPTLPALDLLFAIPNGGHRRKAVAGKLRAEGVKSGVPDICLPVAARGFHGLLIEMKRQHASPSDVSQAQQDWLRKLSEEGYCVRVCKGWEAARRVLLWYLGVTTTE